MLEVIGGGFEVYKEVSNAFNFENWGECGWEKRRNWSYIL